MYINLAELVIASSYIRTLLHYYNIDMIMTSSYMLQH